MSPGEQVEADSGELLTAAFDFDLPQSLIAQVPLPRRDASRLLVLDRETAAISHSSIAHLGEWFSPGDLLVANNSRVIPARLQGRRLPSFGAVEVLLLRREGKAWSALAKPAKRLVPGSRLEFSPRVPGADMVRAEVEENRGAGEVVLRFENDATMHLEQYGATPLPPYITEVLGDAERYQTVYGSKPGSAAAPTAGLHFTKELIGDLQAKGIHWAEITLHVGLDTFRPVTESCVKDHEIHREWCFVSEEAATAIAHCRERGGRVVAVGTTAARTLETAGRNWLDEKPRELSVFTNEFIVPGHRWRLVDALLTNFHLPRSTLLMMVSAFASREVILDAYAEAIERGYRFYSFGDAMLVR